jgi:pyruvate ferredoxin oxidoreductase beta subunit
MAEETAKKPKPAIVKRPPDMFAFKKLPSEEYFVSGHRSCQGCAEVLAVRHVQKALGKDTIVSCATGCMEIVSSPLPTTSWEVPWIHVAFETAASVASGIESGLKALMRKGKISQKKISVVGMGGDGATTDIGFQPLSGAFERGHDMVYVCYDNEAYMNTGIQRSSSTPYGASTTTSPAGKKSIGQQTWKKNMAKIAEAHGIPYVATACSSFIQDLIRKVQRGAEIEGPAYIHVLSVCPTGWRIKPNQSIEAGRLAVETGIFPLYEIENGELTLTYGFEELKPVSEYFKIQGRFRHLTDTDVATIQERVNREYAEIKKRAVKVLKTKMS